MTIPAELRALRQWVLWRYEDRGGPKPTKVPYNTAGVACDVSDPANYASYEEVTALAQHFSGIGIALTKDGNVTGIDLDNPFEHTFNGHAVALPWNDEGAISVVNSHRTIVKHLNSYTEWSPSRMGLRTFVFGKLPSEWRKRIGKVEIYGELRFLTVTGNRYLDDPTSERVEHRQTELEEVARSLGLDKQNVGIDYESRPETRSDVDVYNAIVASKIGQDFLKLYQGDMSDYASGSEADQALANYICYFTDNKEQAYRIFLASQHYANRPKLHERTEYLVGRVINNGFDKKLPSVSFAQLRNTEASVQKLQQAAAPAVTPDPEPSLSQFPPGMLGWIADYIYRSAPYPVPEYALAGAIGLLAGIAGRAFNYSGNGLNQYVVVVGRSGSGKDSISSGISRLLAEFETAIPAARTFQGPQGIASAPALYKLFDREKGGQPSLVCMMPEFGEWLDIHLDPKADGTKKALVQAIMDIYTKSTKGNESGGIAYSDREKNVKTAKSPAFSFIGDTVPHTFYEACTERSIEKGLLTRLLVIERKAPRPDLNKGHHLWRPDDEFINRLGYMIARCLELNEKNDVTQVQHTQEAYAVLEAWRLECDREYQNPGSEAAGNMWSRGHVKAMRLAALSAVGCHWYQPTIDADQARWAVAMAKRDIKNMLNRITSGEIEVRNNNSVDNAYSAEQQAIAQVYYAHITRPYDRLSPQMRSQVPEAAHKAGYMAASTLRNLAGQKPVFRKLPSVHKNATINRVIKDEMNNAIRVGPVSTIDATAASRFGMKVTFDYAFASDFNDVRQMAGIPEDR